MMIPSELLRRTAERYHMREKERKVDLRRGREDWVDAPLHADDRLRVEKRMQRIDLPRDLDARNPNSVLRSLGGPGAALDRLRYERVLGRSDLVGINFLHCGVQVARAVGRILVRDSSRSLLGYGTGFLVSPRVLLTNHHVLESLTTAAVSEIQLGYEDGADGRLQAGTSFELDPGSLFVTNPQLDYTLVALAAPEQALFEYGFCKIIESEGKVLVGEFVNIIQHPNGEPKQLAIRENQIVDLLPDFLHYETDTAPGSSGAAVFNDQWEVVALHHSGVPDMKDGVPMTVDGTPWSPEMGEQRIRWIANEGVRISRIIKDIKLRVADPRQRALIPTIVGAEAIREPESRGSMSPASQALRAAPAAAAGATAQQSNVAVWQVPLTIAVQIGPLGAASIDGRPLGSPDASQSAPLRAREVPPPDSLPRLDDAQLPKGMAVEERTRRPSDYRDRRGYDPSFLGAAHPVALPDLGIWRADAARRIDSDAPEDEPSDDAYVLRYTNFSVVMSASRRMPIFTAVNVAGSELRSLPRRGDTWYFDPRIDRDAQVGNELYVDNPFDRGHMVRRLDPVWGPDAREANEDTFHYTNACPQHASLNQRTWNDLEDYILDNAGARELKVCVLTGPVLREDDPEYRGVQIPREFWKIAAVVDDETGELTASAYLLTQSRIIEDVREFAFGAFRTYQTPIARIGRLTGVDFSHLLAFDVLACSSFREAASLQLPIRGPSDLVLHRRSDASAQKSSSARQAPLP